MNIETLTDGQLYTEFTSGVGSPLFKPDNTFAQMWAEIQARQKLNKDAFKPCRCGHIGDDCLTKCEIGCKCTAPYANWVYRKNQLSIICPCGHSVNGSICGAAHCNGNTYCICKKWLTEVGIIVKGAKSKSFGDWFRTYGLLCECGRLPLECVTFCKDKSPYLAFPDKIVKCPCGNVVNNYSCGMTFCGDNQTYICKCNDWLLENHYYAIGYKGTAQIQIKVLKHS